MKKVRPRKYNTIEEVPDKLFGEEGVKTAMLYKQSVRFDYRNRSYKSFAEFCHKNSINRTFLEIRLLRGNSFGEAFDALVAKNKKEKK